jgi:CRP/FNR family cyclic AMP-dependent transcriptional regulator
VPRDNGNIGGNRACGGKLKAVILPGRPLITVNDGRGPWPPGSLLASLPEASRQRLLGLGAKQQYAGAGRILVREGDKGTVVYLLLAGSVKVTGATDDGDALLAVRVGGDIVGELAALDGRPRAATVTTAGPVIARIIGQAEFLGLLTRDPALSLALTREVSDKLRSATSRRIEFTRCDVNTRFARVLLDLAERYGENTPAGRTIGCPLTQTELATLAGAAEPTVQRSLRQLKAEGVVSIGYRVTTVLDMDALRRRAFPPPE